VLEGSASGKYAVVGGDGGALTVDGMLDGRGLDGGEYVVFTAVEVAEKRGRHCSASASKGVRDGLRTSSPRHWVRLPWCNSLRVAAVRMMESEAAVTGSGVADGVALPEVGLPFARLVREDESGGPDAEGETALLIGENDTEACVVDGVDFAVGERLSWVVLMDIVALDGFMVQEELDGVMAGGP
jgi:hypothetical protein